MRTTTTEEIFTRSIAKNISYSFMATPSGKSADLIQLSINTHLVDNEGIANSGFSAGVLSSLGFTLSKREAKWLLEELKRATSIWN